MRLTVRARTRSIVSALTVEAQPRIREKLDGIKQLQVSLDPADTPGPEPGRIGLWSSRPRSDAISAIQRRAAGTVLRVLVVSGVRLYAEGLTRALEADAELSVCATASDCTALLDLLGELDPDVVLVDIAGLDDRDDLRALVGAASPTPFVALAVRPEDAEVVDWAEAGVVGIVTREATLDELTEVVRGAASGAAPSSAPVTAALLRRVVATAGERAGESLPELTARERQIAQLLEQGLSNKEIAARLFLGLSTVKNHVHNLLGKLDANSRAEVALRVRRATEPRRGRAGA